jgi:hypothetical protein
MQQQQNEGGRPNRRQADSGAQDESRGRDTARSILSDLDVHGHYPDSECQSCGQWWPHDEIEDERCPRCRGKE